jgi:hypothetical protein
MRTSRAALCATVLLVLGSAPQFAEACTATYLDFNVNTAQSKIEAWSWVEDYYNFSPCFDEAYWALGWWSHSYQASVHITSPTQNVAWHVDSLPNVDYGGGSASAYASISYIGEPGTYVIELEADIGCNWGGMFVQDVQHHIVQQDNPCDDPEVLSIVQEYVTRGIHNLSTRPSVDCSRFRGPVNSQYFQWNYELNGITSERHDNWAWLEDAFLNALDSTRVTYGHPIQGTGAYRCPNKNDMVGSTQPLSWHQYGRAADVVNHSSRPRTEAEWNNIRIAAQLNGATVVIELVNNDINHPGSHLHLQWPNIPW